jgi:hypothetical protein
MPLYLHISNLVVAKSSVIAKYDGGMTQFREDFGFGKIEYRFEDHELFLLTAMDPNDFNIDLLIKRGLHYDHEFNFSNDFVLIHRYGTFSWEAEWLERTNQYVWHFIADEHLKEIARKYSDMCLNDIIEMTENGNSPFLPIV